MIRFMKAVRFHTTGEPADVLTVEDTDSPTPGPGEVRVRMLASPINPADLMYIRGIYGKEPTLPATPGFEGVGVVEAGSGPIGHFLRRKRVAVLNRERGNWAEQTIAAARQVIPLSDRIPVEQAACFFVNPATAWIMTRAVLRIPRGEWLVQTAAASALGRMVVRLGRHYGFRTLCIVRREEQAEQLRQLGADAAIVFDESAAGSLEEMVREHIPDGPRFAIDPVGGRTGSAVIESLGHGARMLVYGTLSQQPLNFSPRQLMTRAASVEGFWLSNYMNNLGLLAKLRLIRQLSRLIQNEVISTEIGQTFPLADVQQAVAAADASGRPGKVLLQISET